MRKVAKFSENQGVTFTAGKKVSIFGIKTSMKNSHPYHIYLLVAPGPGTYRSPSDFGHYVSRKYLDGQNQARILASRPNYPVELFKNLQEVQRNTRHSFYTQVGAGPSSSLLYRSGTTIQTNQASKRR
jgi:hypothetical protein